MTQEQKNHRNQFQKNKFGQKMFDQDVERSRVQRRRRPLLREGHEAPREEGVADADGRPERDRVAVGLSCRKRQCVQLRICVQFNLL
jgi:dephospho-CoA kinase